MIENEYDEYELRECEKRIIFKGELSKTSKRYLIKQRLIAMCVVGLPTCIICCVLIIGASFLIHSRVNWFLIVPAWMMVSWMIASIVSKYFPMQIEVNDDVLIATMPKNKTETKLSADVVKVIDTGDSYQMVFALPYVNQLFICEKNLLAEGSLEDFEELFHNRIERKV